MSDDTWVLMVNPEDVDLAEMKAKAAALGATVVANRFVPRGQAFRTRQSVLDFAKRWTVEQ